MWSPQLRIRSGGQRGGGANGERVEEMAKNLGEDKPRGASMAACFHVPSKKGCPGTFPKAYVAIAS